MSSIRCLGSNLEVIKLDSVPTPRYILATEQSARMAIFAMKEADSCKRYVTILNYQNNNLHNDNTQLSTINKYIKKENRIYKTTSIFLISTIMISFFINN